MGGSWKACGLSGPCWWPVRPSVSGRCAGWPSSLISSRPCGRPEYHVGPQRRDPLDPLDAFVLDAAQVGQQARADPVALLRAEGVHGGPVARPEHDVPEPVGMIQLVLA